MYNLDDGESSHLICCEITSTRKKTGLFANGNETKITGMLVTTQLLVWPNGRKRGKLAVTSAMLCNIDAHDFENSAMYQVNPDSCINITGRYTDVTRQGQAFIGLGTDSAERNSARCCSMPYKKRNRSGRYSSLKTEMQSE